MNKMKDISLSAVKTLILPVMVYLFFLFMTLIMGKQPFGTSLIAMKTMLQQSVFGLIVALAFSMHLLSSRIDFSLGAEIILSAIIGGNLAVKLGTGPYGLLFLCILTGIILSSITGSIYILMKLPPLIVTLAVLLIYEALTLILFDGSGITIYSDPKMTFFARSPQIFILALASMAVFYFIINHTQFGYNMRSLANGQRIAINIGVSEKKNVLQTFIIAGLFIGIAATVYLSTQGQARPVSNLSSTQYMFAAFTPVIVGLYLARFSSISIGILFASLSTGLLMYGLVAIGVNASLQNVVNGVFLVVFIGVTSNQERFKHYMLQKKRAQSLKNSVS